MVLCRLTCASRNCQTYLSWWSHQLVWSATTTGRFAHHAPPRFSSHPPAAPAGFLAAHPSAGAEGWPVMGRQCGRSRGDGRRCAALAASWGLPDPAAPVADPVACWAHLSEVERAVRVGNLAREVAGAEPLGGRGTREGRKPTPPFGPPAADAPPSSRALPPLPRDDADSPPPASAARDRAPGHAGATRPQPAEADPPPWPPQRPTLQTPTSHSLRKSLTKAAFLLATNTGRHPGAVNTELNGVMGVSQRAEASKEQLREGLRYVGGRLRAGGAGVTFSGDPPF